MPVKVEIQGSVTYIRLDDGQSNILTFEFIEEIYVAIAKVETPIFVVTSTAQNFSVGVDVKIHTPELSERMLKEFHKLIRVVYHFHGISIGALNGYALGGGLELGLACDFLVAEKQAQLGFPEILLGCFPPVAALLLPRRICTAKAKRLLFSGQTIGAMAAFESGLIDEIFDDKPDPFVNRIQQQSTDAMMLLKKTLRATSGVDFDGELSMAENIYLTELIKSPDMIEGVQAFLEKRKPKFKK
jgi:cyclohexa-1,5-dienecarbonyl-CoA hydratase